MVISKYGPLKSRETLLCALVVNRLFEGRQIAQLELA